MIDYTPIHFKNPNNFLYVLLFLSVFFFHQREIDCPMPQATAQEHLPFTEKLSGKRLDSTGGRRQREAFFGGKALLSLPPSAPALPPQSSNCITIVNFKS